MKTEQSYKFLKNVKGSSAYWQHEHSLGIPTWFMTLSASDLHWVEMIEAVSIHNHKPLTWKNIHKMSIKAWSEKLKANLVTSVQMFQYCVESFFTHYIFDDSNPVDKVKEYAIKIEFQEHGSPHAHCLLWVGGTPQYWCWQWWGSMSIYRYICVWHDTWQFRWK